MPIEEVQNAVMLKFNADASPVTAELRNFLESFRGFNAKVKIMSENLVGNFINTTELLKANFSNVFPKNLGQIHGLTKGILNNKFNLADLFPSFYKGGVVKHTGAYTLHKGEQIIPKSAIARIIGFKDLFPSFKMGTNFVPRDTLAYLHRGEKVIPEKENYQTINFSSPNIYITGTGLDAREIADEIKRELNIQWSQELGRLSR